MHCWQEFIEVMLYCLCFKSVCTAITKHHRWGGLSNKQLFLTALEAGKTKNKGRTDLPSGEGFLVHRRHLLAMSPHSTRVEGMI